MAGNSWIGVVKYDCLKAANDVEYANNAIPKTPCFVAYTHDFQGLVGNDAKIELLKQQDEKFTHEAGIYIAKTKTNVFTSNYQSGKKVDIHEVDCSDSSGKVTIDSVRLASFPQDEIIYANGGCNYNGNLLFCAQGSFNHPSALPSAPFAATLANINLSSAIMNMPTGEKLKFATVPPTWIFPINSPRLFQQSTPLPVPDQTFPSVSHLMPSGTPTSQNANVLRFANRVPSSTTSYS